jgi:sterol desaturase/sphingolipid hydroxylase (fatty acid hydroxylase superfamily)
VLKLICGYVLGKVYAYTVHWVMHIHPMLYRIHKKHHGHPRNLVASKSWEDSIVEYIIMELPSFAFTVLCFPTHILVHYLHFCWHGYDGAAGHSGFGIVESSEETTGKTQEPFSLSRWLLEYLFDGTYHYYHHAYLNINYGEIEFLDYMAGTHHSQSPKYSHAINKAHAAAKAAAATTAFR